MLQQGGFKWQTTLRIHHTLGGLAYLSRILRDEEDPFDTTNRCTEDSVDGV